MKTILVPTDFSRCAANALKYALEVARRTGATVYVLNVVLPYEQLDGLGGHAIWLEEYLDERRIYLERFVQRLARKPANVNLTIRPVSAIGFPVVRILEEADRRKADLIVLGTTGTTGLTRLFIGSTTGGVLEQTRVPVLAVPPKGHYRAFRHIALATDFESFPDQRSLAALRAVLFPQTKKLEVIHILNRMGEYSDQASEQEFSKKLTGFEPKFHYLHGIDVSGEIVQLLESVKAEALVTVTRHRSLMERLLSRSTSKELARRAPVPVLVLHEAV